MFGYFVLLCVLSAASFSEAIKCYHCYDSYNETYSLISSDSLDFDANFVRCDKNRLKWNTWDCPAKFPVCIIMTGIVQGHYEIVRSCGKRDFCPTYNPPVGVKLTSCRECETEMCNDYPVVPDPPVEPLFVFNVNINLKVNKYPSLSDEHSDKYED